MPFVPLGDARARGDGRGVRVVERVAPPAPGRRAILVPRPHGEPLEAERVAVVEARRPAAGVPVSTVREGIGPVLVGPPPR